MGLYKEDDPKAIFMSTAKKLKGQVSEEELIQVAKDLGINIIGDEDVVVENQEENNENTDNSQGE